MTESLMDPALRFALTTFARICRWGTCVECPRDGDGWKLPELCANTKRYDHQLNWKDLTEAIEHEFTRPRGSNATE